MRTCAPRASIVALLLVSCAAAPRSRSAEPFAVPVVIEIPAGSRQKYEFRGGAFVLDRVLPEEVGGYPVNYGFVPCSRAPDGDPLDVLVSGPPRPTGTALRVPVTGLLRMVDEKGDDPKLLSVAPNGPKWSSELRRDVAAFFNAYKAGQPGVSARVLGFGDRAEARHVLDAFTLRDAECERAAIPTVVAPP
jgi:inorganic pyrophosphatase